jgi:cell division protein FtsB
MTRINKTACFLAILAAATLLDCGASLSLTVDPSLIKRLPKSSRRSVFQAETVVTIAVDQKSTTGRQIESTKREIARTEERIRDLKKHQETAPAREADKIDMEIDMLDAKVDYLEDKVDHLRYVLKLRDKELLLARAQFELAKVKLVKKHSISFDGSEEDFVDQVRSLQEKVDEFRKDVEEDAADLKVSENEWLAVKKRYFSAVGESSKGWWTE